MIGLRAQSAWCQDRDAGIFKPIIRVTPPE